MGNRSKSSDLGTESLAQRLKFVLEKRRWEFEDVIFKVGPEAESVKGVKLILVASSPVFERMLSDLWYSNGNNRDDRDNQNIQLQSQSEHDPVIYLPDISPKIFTHFLQLLLLDNLKIDNLKELDYSIENVFDLLYIAKKYLVSSIRRTCLEFLEAETNLENACTIYENAQSLPDEEELQKDTIKFIRKYVVDVMTKDSFLKMSKETLAKILCRDDLDVDEITLFEGVCKWAEFHCLDEELEVTGENMRKVLGDSLFHIRFPLISLPDFLKVVCIKNILKEDEISSLWPVESPSRQLSSPISNKKPNQNLPPSPTFSREPRRKGLFKTVSFHSCQLDETVPFGDGEKAERFAFYMMVDKKIQISSFGFYGPILEDSNFDIDIIHGPGPFTHRVFAEKGKVFHVKLNQPFTVEPKQFSYIMFAFKGGQTPSTVSYVDPPYGKKQQDGINFGFFSTTRINLAEISYKEL